MAVKKMRALSLLLFVCLLTSLGGCDRAEEKQTSESSPVTEQTMSSPAQPSESLPQQTTQLLLAKNAAAEAYYQQLLAQYGENYQQCLESIAQLTQAPQQAPQPAIEVSPSPSPSKQLNVVVALDASGSMAGTVNGEQKLALAKSAIAQFVSGLPQTAKVGLTVFGHQGSNKEADKAVSCAGIETVYPLAQLESQFTQAINSFEPTGFTPLAATLEQLNQNFSTLDGAANQNVVYLVSDGIETCDGNPVIAAQKLHASNAQAIVNTIGFDVDNKAQRQLRAIAVAGGGEYFSARNAAELQKIFQDRRQNLSENRSELNNTTWQNPVYLEPTSASNQLFVCITTKLNREALNLLTALNRVKLEDPNSQYNEYVLARINERLTQITTWRNRLQADLVNRREVTTDKLKQNLDQVTREYKANTNQSTVKTQQ
jgi:Ca-activated chloride channel family protein